MKRYSDITYEELEQILAETVLEAEAKRNKYKVLTNKKGALAYLKESYKDFFTEKEAEKNLKIAEKELTEGSYVITPTGISPYGFRLSAGMETSNTKLIEFAQLITKRLHETGVDIELSFTKSFKKDKPLDVYCGRMGVDQFPSTHPNPKEVLRIVVSNK